MKRILVMTEKEKELARWIQGDLPAGSRPFQTIGRAIGLEEDEVIALINRLKACGAIRRFAAIVRHGRVGYKKNALVVWAVPEALCEATGRLFASHKEISHCYERTPPYEGRYNLFTMVHVRDGNPEAWIRELAALSGVSDFKILFSEEEFKKTSMTYFA